MKERPILFSAPMVRAILERRKTQTRRVVKPQPTVNFIPSVGPFHPACIDSKTGECFPGELTYGASDEYEGFTSPYGQPGDRLWVRETFSTGTPCDCQICADPKHAVVSYRATWDGSTYVDKWKPSIFMARKFSRITLEIVAVRVERLHDISEGDCYAEGITRPPKDGAFPHTHGAVALVEYIALWESINGPGSWEKNPWVWVVEFKRL